MTRKRGLGFRVVWVVSFQGVFIVRPCAGRFASLFVVVHRASWGDYVLESVRFLWGCREGCSGARLGFLSP